MRILGLDIATKTGYAVYDTDQPLNFIKANSFTIKADSEERRPAVFAKLFIEVIKQEQPQFVMIEEPLKNIIAYKKKSRDLVGEFEAQQTMNPRAVIMPNQFFGSAAAVCQGFNIPYDVVPAGTWRKCFLGIGRNPKLDRQGWKKLARDKCSQLNISVTNDDQADAVGVAFYAPNSQQFRMMQQGGLL